MKRSQPNTTNGQSGEDRAWKIAQLAATLASKTYLTAEVANGERKILMEHNRKVELGWAIEQADYVLAAAEYTARTKHAYELFDSDWYTRDRAARIFRKHSWPNLKSWHSVEQLLEEILKELKAMAQPPSSNSAALQLGLSLPKVIPPDGALFWRDPGTLKRAHKGKQTVYQVRDILLAAHAYLRQQFKDRIEQ
jgi:hypothetical protein